MHSLYPLPSGNCDGTDLRRAPVLDSHPTKAGRFRTYDVQMTMDDVGACCKILKELIGPRAALVVSTPTVSRLFSSDIYEQLHRQNDRVSSMVLKCNEATKSVEQVMRICEQALNVGLDRTGLLVAIGGGVCTDIVTVAASWIRRSVDYIRVPTTLVGQVDAGIGIKGAVNFCGKKSYLGCFYPPTAVVIAPAFLRTLPPKHLREGCAEIIKIAMVRDQRLFELLESSVPELLASGFAHGEQIAKEVLWRSIVAMLDELEPNIYEDQTHERLLDFGHTFSPALEAASNFTVSHGEAVAIDMALSAVLANQLGLLTADVSTRLLHLLFDWGLPMWSPLLTVDLCRRALQEMALHRGGRPNLVLPTSIGKAVFLGEIETLSNNVGRAIKTLEHVARARNVPHKRGRQDGGGRGVPANGGGIGWPRSPARGAGL